MGAIKPQPGEYWMTERGKVIGPLAKDSSDFFPLFVVLETGSIWWSLNGYALGGWDMEPYGNLTRRVNPDGTPWKAPKARKTEYTLADCLKALAKAERLAHKMSKAPSIREARKIYNNSVKGEK